MIQNPFDYVRATTLSEALAALAEFRREAKLLAGGHSVLPMMKLGLAEPSVVVDIRHLRDLDYIDDAADHVAVGALTAHRTVETSPLVQTSVPLLAHVAAHVGDEQVRARGTVGGAIAHGDGASDLCAAALALRATVVVEGPQGRRQIAIDDFFVGYLETALGPDEMIVELRVPKVPGAAWSFQKYRRRHLDWAIVGCAAVRDPDRGLGVGLVNMGSRPTRAVEVETADRRGADITEASDLVAAGCEPPSDLHASAEYRVELARVLVNRALDACRVA